MAQKIVQDWCSVEVHGFSKPSLEPEKMARRPGICMSELLAL